MENAMDYMVHLKIPFKGHTCAFSPLNMFVVSCQTAEEIDQLTVDEDLNDIERAVYLLR